MHTGHMTPAIPLPHERRRQGVRYRLNWQRLSIVSGVCAIGSFVFVHTAMNAPLSEEQSFANKCRQLNGLVLKDPVGKVMDDKLVCLRREALLGWRSRD